MSQHQGNYPDLKNRSVFISGGATGIGEALVDAFAGQGATVSFVDIDEVAGHALADRLNGNNSTVTFYPCDLTDTKSYQSILADAGHAQGPITILMNNAANDMRHSLADVTSDSFDQAVAINLKHSMFAAQSVAPMMKAEGGGSIVNFGSISWMMAHDGFPVYATCKAALHGTSRSLARELGQDHIRVNTLSPGWVMTEKQKRLWLDDDGRKLIKKSQCLPGELLPDHVASMALFLGSDASRMISAQNFIVDGGWV
jgi:NAD(P)-dependent dehydrogenase (short-subunit alcohol dehydrogenase family)